MTDQHKQNKSREDNFDRAFIGKPGCMGIVSGIIILFIIYALFIAK
ncbi:hypothetical protein ACFP7A_04080 [Sporolactobacillus kofuensis]|uniref:Uncharacterized protein n=1 Tax=Sporolactobacillus kofuensis TaxID=269672 RepID=A0ABW1WB30_9BACL|nr:hypothetical protein [Sporolactobacillus kofuensis]MCO7174979.1 hypothetical protein [Sporolactobacillus kofuensis]